jgi:hypothetical protein
VKAFCGNGFVERKRSFENLLLTIIVGNSTVHMLITRAIITCTVDDAGMTRCRDSDVSTFAWLFAMENRGLVKLAKRCHNTVSTATSTRITVVSSLINKPFDRHRRSPSPKHSNQQVRTICWYSAGMPLSEDSTEPTQHSRTWRF